MQPTRRELDHIRKSFTYNAKTGIVRWHISCKFLRRVKPGSIAGMVVKGYIYIMVGGRRCYAHQIAWLLMTGVWPPKGFEVDHEDRNGLHNKWSNLRLATSSQNKFNCKVRVDSDSGVRGVAHDRARNKWQVHITAYKRRICLGRFELNDLETAAKVRRAAELKYFGKYAPK